MTLSQRKERELMNILLRNQEDHIQNLMMIIEMLIRYGQTDDHGPDSDSGPTPDTKLAARSQQPLSADPPTDYHQ